MTDYLRVDRPVFAPSCCLLCTRSSDPDGFVDLGRDLNATHPDARVYVCSRCSSQLGAAFGMVAAVDAQALRVSLAEAEGEIVVLGQRVDQAEGRGSWTWTPTASTDDLIAREVAQGRPNFEGVSICPDCGESKGPTSKRCRSCSARIASEARKTGTAA